MAYMWAAPNFERAGVVAGFVLSLGAGLVPGISKGVLFAQDMYRPAAAPVLPAAPAAAQSWLFYSAANGFYWRAVPTPAAADDAFLGWVRTDGTSVRAVSAQRVIVGDGPAPAVFGLGTAQPRQPQWQEDAAAPPAPTFGGLTRGDGYFELGSLGFPSIENCHTVHTATLTLWAWDEKQLTAVWGDLTAELPIGGTVLHAEMDPYSDGDYAVVDQEVVRLVSVDKGADTAVVERGKFGTAEANHQAESFVFRLSPHVFTYSFPPDFFSGIGQPGWIGGGWQGRVPFRDMRVVAASLYVTNSRGNSPAGEGAWTANADNGLRTMSGEKLDLVVDGVLGIQSSAVARVYLPRVSSWKWLQARVEEAPVGGPVQVNVIAGAGAIGVATIPAGELVSSVVDGRDVSAIDPSWGITLDIAAVGSTFPGRRLTVEIQF